MCHWISVAIRRKQVKTQFWNLKLFDRKIKQMGFGGYAKNNHWQNRWHKNVNTGLGRTKRRFLVDYIE